MKKVLIGQSYYLRFDPKLWAAAQPYPPLGSLYAAAILREEGFDVHFFDSMLADSEQEWRAALEEQKPQWAVIYEDNFNYLSKMCLGRMREAAFAMIESARKRGCAVIVAGSDATDHSPLYLKAGADAVLIGEGEATLTELLRRWQDPSSVPPRVAGSVRSGEEAALELRRPLEELDRLPRPAWDLVDLERYRRIWMRKHGYYSINMVTTRGCPYGCNWCAKPIWGRRYHSRTPQDVVAEMGFLRERIRPDHIWFADDIFGLKPGWIEEFAALVEEEKVRTPFKCLLRADLVTPELSAALARSGCRTVWIGAESGAQSVLDAMEKGARVEDSYRAARLLRQQGIEIGFFLQFGYPGEGWEEIEKTLQMVWDVMPDDIGVSVSYPLPGTPFYDRVKAEMGTKLNWEDSADLDLLFRGKYPPEFYRQLHRVLHVEYRMRKALRKLRGGRMHALKPLARAVTLPLEKARLRRLRGGPG